MATDKVQFDILVNASPAEKALNDFARTVDKTVRKVSSKMEAMEKSFRDISKHIKLIDSSNSFKGMSKDLGHSNKKLKEMEKRLKNINRLSGKVGGGMSSSRNPRRGGVNSRLMSGASGLIGGLGAYGLMGLIQGIPEAGIKFESSMVDIGGILSGKGGMGNLESQIRAVGKGSSYTINEMAGAAKFMAMAGMDSQQIGGSLSSVSNLGMVGNLGVERSADIITNIMSSMGLDASKKGYTSAVSDIITGTFTNANVSIEEIGQSMSYVGNIAAQVGMDIKQTSAAIGILGNNGIKASRAGTGLRQMFLKLAAPTKKGKETIEALNLNLYEIGKNGKSKLKPLSNILKQIKDSGAGAKELKDIFGVYGQQAVGALVSSFDKYKELEDKISGSGNITEQLAQKKRNTTAGRLFVLKSVWEDFSITLMDKVRPAFDYVVDGLTRVIEKLSKNGKFLTWVENAAMGVAKGLEIAYHVLKWLFNLIIDNEAGVIGVLTAMATWMGIVASKSLLIAVTNPFTAWLIAGFGVLKIMDEVLKRLPADENQPDASLSEGALANRYRTRLAGAGNDEYWKLLGRANDPTLTSAERQAARDRRNANQRDRVAASNMSDQEIIDYYQSNKMSRYEKIMFMQEQRENVNKPQNKSQKIKADIMSWLKKSATASGLDVDKLEKIMNLDSTILANVGGVSGGTNEGDGKNTLASPLTSQANEMSRSIVVNFNADSALAKIEVGSGSGIADEQVKADIEQQMSEVFLKVVSDFELGMSH